MDTLKKIALFAALLGFGSLLSAQSVDDIIAKHLEAIGGKEKLRGVISVHIENTMQLMGNTTKGTIVILNGKAYRSESKINGQQMVQVFTSTGGWAINPMTGGSEPQPIPEERYKAGEDQIYIVPFLEFAERGSKVELLSSQRVGNVNAYKIKLTNKDNISVVYLFDPQSYYIIQTIASAEMMGQQMELVTTYSDYKKTDYGWVVPHSIDMSIGGQFSISIFVKKIEVNAPLDISIFDIKKETAQNRLATRFKDFNQSAL